MSRIGPRIDSYEDARARPCADWITIEERWPPSSVPVLVLLSNGSYAVLNRYRGDWWPGDIPCDDAWVHLPKPPEMIAVPRKPRDRKRSKLSKPARGAKRKQDRPRERKGREES